MITTVGLLASALAAPANADWAEWVGFTCGFASTNDPTGVVNQDPNAQTGVMNTGIMLAVDLLDDSGGGPLISPHFPFESLTSVTQHCWIQINGASYATHGPIPSAHCHFNSVINGAPGPVLMLPQGCPITYSAGPTDSVYLCTTWVFTHDSRTENYYWDDVDDPHDPSDGGALTTPVGAECGLAINSGA